MRVCFLDFDGVLNTQKWIATVKERHTDPWPGGPAPSWNTPEYDTWSEFINTDPECVAWSRKHDLAALNPEHVAHLNTLVERTDCVICISSSWRKIHPLENLAEMLSVLGFKYPERIVGRTPGLGTRRGREIHAWLEERALLVTGIVILDDDGDMEPYLDKLVKTHFFKGALSEEHVERAVEVIQQPFTLR